MAKVTLFQDVHNYINKFADKFNSSATSGIINDLHDTIIMFITMMVIIKGYLILAGKSNEPFKDLIYDSMIKMIIAIVIISPTWISLVNNAIEGLSHWAAGNVDIYEKLDNATEVTLKLVDIVSKKGPTIFVTFHVVGFLIGVAILFFFGIFATIFLIAIIYSSITLKIIVMLSPIMIGTLAFGWIKQVFSRWIELIISNTLLVLLLGIIVDIFIKVYNEVIKESMNRINDSNIFLVGLKVSIVSILLAWIVIMAKGIAQQLAGASIEHLPESSAKELGDKFKRKK